MRKSQIMAIAASPFVLGGITLAVAAAPAGASTGPSNGQAGQLTGHASPAKYIDPVFGGVQCNETQHPAFDTVSCKFTGGNPAFVPLSTGSVGWNSDFTSSTHPTGTLTYTINADGSGYSGQATYPDSLVK